MDSVASVSSGDALPRLIGTGVAIVQLCFGTLAYADSITTTGRTETTLLRDGNVIDISTTSVHGINAFNEFARFNVERDETVNLFVPDQAQNLLNLIRDEATVIDGLVNSWFQGQLGGNVFFLNPRGIVIGEDGKVNVGSLTLVTPTESFMNAFFDETLQPDAASTIQVLEGQVPIDPNGLITVHGHVLATNSVAVDAGAVAIGGSISAGGADVTVALSAANLINLEGMDAATSVSISESGSVTIHAAGDLVNTGQIQANGADGIDAGRVELRAGGDLTLAAGSLVSTAGMDLDSGGGVIDLYAEDSAYLNAGAMLDASAGIVGGDGGAVEFGAGDRVVLDGGQFRVDGAQGEGGSVRMASENIEIVSANLLTDGDSLELEASESVTVGPNVVISTRRVADATNAVAHATALSTGNSGNLSLTAPVITLEDGSALYAQAFNDGGTTFAGGDVDLSAIRDDSGTARITLTNADVRGANVTLNANVTSDTDVLDLLVLDATAIASIAVNGSTITADEAVQLSTGVSIDASTGLLPLPFSSIDANAQATVEVLGASSISTGAGGNVTLSANADVTTNATPNSFLNDLAGDAAFGRSDVTSDATVHVGGSTQIASGGAVTLSAINAIDATAVADASAAGAAAAGAAVAVSVVNATTSAYVDGAAAIISDGDLAVTADSSVASQALARAATQGASEDMDGESEGAQTLDAYSDEASTSDGVVQVAGAVAVGDITNTTQASLGSTMMSQISGAAAIISNASESSTVTGDGSASAGSVGVGVGVAVNIGRSDNSAFIDQNLAAIGIDLRAGDGTTSQFATSATAGAGASNVGVAGALAINVLDDEDLAEIRSGTVTVGGGDLGLHANSNTSSSASAVPVEDGGATGDSVGVGASVAMNIAAHSARAQVADGATVNGVDNLAISGTGRHDVMTEAEAGAAGGVAVTPVLALALVDNQTLAQLGTGSALAVDGAVDIVADHRGTLATTATGNAQGETAAIGGAFAITTITDTAGAKVERNITAGDAVAISAFNGSVSSSSATASAKGGDDDDSDNEGGVDQAITRQQSQADTVQASNGVGNDGQSMDDQEAPSAESSEGKVNVAAAVSVNVVSSSATAELSDSVNVTGGGRLTVASSNNTDGAASTDASAVGGDAQVGVGAAVSINRVASHNRATVGNGNIDVAGLTVSATMTELDGADTTNTALVSSMSGAGGSNVGVAGSLALNVIDSTTIAEVRDGAQVMLGGADVVVMAAQESDLSAMALPTEDGGATGGKVGVGASVALNLGDGQTTRARIGDNVGLSDAASLTVDANGTYDVTTEAKAGAEGGVAVDAVVALAVLDETTEATVGGGALVQLGGDLVISAQSSGTRATMADADVQSESVGVGAAAAVVTSSSRTRAVLARDVTATGGLLLSAMASREYDTEAKAGAKGADMTSVEEPSDRRDNTTSTSTLDDNSDAQRGGKDGGKVSVAAAVAVSVIDDDVEAKVTGGRTLTADGDISVSATNESNFSSRGRGDAVDSMVAVGIGVGVGLSIAKNDTLASLDDGTRIVDADTITVHAQSQQNTADDYVNKLAAEAIAGAGARRVGVAGAFGVAFSETTTRADVGQIVVDNAGDMVVAVDNTSKLSAKAWSGAAGRVGVGASVATVYSDNEYAATIAAGSDITVDGLAVTATNHVVDGEVGFDFKDFATLTENNLQLILGTNNYYTEAVAGSGGSGVAVSGAFAVNIFNDVIRAEIEAPAAGEMATSITADGDVEVSSKNDVRAKAFAGALAAASKVGVGVSSADIANMTRSISSIAGNINAADVAVTANSGQDFVTFGVSGSGAGNTGVSGAANVIVSENEVRASIAEDSEVLATNNVVVAANNDIDVTNIAGGAAGGGTAGIGISAAVNVIDNVTRAEIARDATVRANAQGMSTMVPLGNTGGDTLDVGGVAVAATASEDLFTIAAGGGGGGSAGVAGSSAVNVLGVSTLALIAEGVLINDNTMAGSIDQSVYVLAADHTDSITVAGAAAGGGSAGVGAGADVSVMNKDTQAYIQAADVRARGNVRVAARSSEDISSIAATVGIGGSAGIAGSAGVQVVDIKTRAFIGQDDQPLATPTAVIADGSVVIEAEDKTEIDVLAGGVSGGGSAGIGASAVVAVINKQTDAFIGANSRVDGLGMRAPVDAATGGFMVTRITPVEEEGQVGPAGGDNNADLTDDGSDDIDEQALTTERVATPGRDSFSGVAVTATNQDDIATIAASGGAAGSVAVNVSGNVVVLDAATTARIGEGATVNMAGGAAADQAVRVAATNDFQRLGVAAAASIAGAVGVTPGAEITVASLNTLATIDSAAVVNAGADVEVLATASEDVLTVAAGAAGSGTVAVGGAVSVVSIDSNTRAQIGADAQDNGEAATVTAGGNVIVAADDRTESLLVAGSLGVGIGAAGIGGSVGVTSINKDTRALVGNFATVTAAGNSDNVNGIALAEDAAMGPLATRDNFSGVLVQATSAESVKSIAAAAAAGFYAGLAGGVSIQTIDSDTVAAVGSSATVSTGGGNQEVLIGAANAFDGFGFGGGLGGGIVGVGGGVDIGTVKNDTSASVGNDTTITSSGDTTLLARADKDVHSIAASAAGGAVAVAGSVSVWSLGTASDDGYSVEEENQETGETTTQTDAAVDEDGLNSTTDHVDSQSGLFASLLDGFNDPDMNADAMAGLQSASNDVNNVQAGTAASTALNDVSPVAGTSAIVGDRAVITAGDDLSIRAADHTAFRVDAGSVSVGGAGIGAAIGVANIQNSTTARVGNGAFLAAGSDADDDISVLASLEETIDGLLAVGAAGGLALGAQVLVVNDTSSQSAMLGNGVSVSRAGGAVNVSAAGVRSANLDSAGATIGSVAAGVAVAVADFGGGSTAEVGAVDIGTSDSVGGVSISASQDDDIDVKTLSVAAGTASRTGSFAVANTNASVSASIGDGATIETDGAIDITAASISDTKASATGVAVSVGASGGASVARATANPDVTATVGDNVTLDADGSITVQARHNVDQNGVTLANTGAEADAIAGAGSLIGSAAGALATAQSGATVRAAIANGMAPATGTQVTAAGDVLVAARASNSADASTVGVAVAGVAGIGISLANANVAGVVEAVLAANRVSGGNIAVDAVSLDVAKSESLAGAGGIIAGSGAIATSDIDSSTAASTGAGSELVSGNAVTVTALATTDADAMSTGISGGLAAVGVSQATASTTPRVDASLGNATQLTAQVLTVSAERRLPDSGPSSLTQVSGSSGGLIGVNATQSMAEDNASVAVSIGDGSNLNVSGMANFAALNTSRQDANATSVTVGYIAAGANLATATSDNSTTVQFGNGGSLLAGQLAISATGNDTNYADSTAGSGGVISGSAATATTDTTATTLADTGNNSFVVTDFTLSAEQTSRFDSRVNSVNASLVGASGASANNTADGTAIARVGAGSMVMADNIGIVASNTVRKNRWGASASDWNITSGSGGAIDAPAAQTLTQIDTNSLVDIGDGAFVLQPLMQQSDRDNPGQFTLNAFNDVVALDRVRMNSGGAVAIAKGQSRTIADSILASVIIGQDAALSGIGDIGIGTRSVGNVRNAVAVDTYGLAGAPQGLTTSTFRTTNSVDVRENARITALRDLRIGAGTNTAGDDNAINATSRTDLWNNTLIPINGTPDADATIATDNRIGVATGARIEAVRDARLLAVRGSTSASGVGIAKDIYREALAAAASAISNAFGGGDVSFDIHGGSRKDTSSGAVTVDGSVRVGTESRLELTLDVELDPDTGDRAVVERRRVNGVEVNADEGIQTILPAPDERLRGIAGDLLDRIDALYELILEYQVDDESSSAGIAVRAYEAEIAFLERKLEDLGFPVDGDQTGFTGAQDESPRDIAAVRLARAQERLAEAEMEQMTLVDANMVLEDENTVLESQNTTLGGQNTTLLMTNTTLMSDNEVLQMEIVTLMDMQVGLDPTSPEYLALQAQIDMNQATIDANMMTISDNDIEIAANQMTIMDNLVTIGENQIVINMNAMTIMDLDSDIMQANDDIVDIGDLTAYSNEENGGPVAEFRTIDKVTAQLGNIFIEGTDLTGNGLLESPGNALIRIENNTPLFLNFNDLIIPANSGGKLFVNNVDVSSNAAINAVNRSASGANFSITTGASAGAEAPRIEIVSNYDPLNSFYVENKTPTDLPPLAPDVIINADSVVSNLRGLIKIDLAAGNIRIENDVTIAGDTIDIKTLNGDFIQSYTEGFTHVGGTPLGVDAGTSSTPSTVFLQTQTGPGIVANGSVLLAGRYLNINGTVQSGIPEWGVVIPTESPVRAPSVNGMPGMEFPSFAAARAYFNSLPAGQPAGAELFEVLDASLSGLPGSVWGERAEIAVNFNARENRLELAGVQVQGGYIELFGQLFNTNSGVGRLRVLDGFGQLRIDNTSGLDLMLNVLDTGRGVRGQVSITNILNDESIADTAIYERAPGAPRTGVFFNPQSDLRFVTIAGSNRVTETRYVYAQQGWFGIDSGANSLSSSDIVSGPTFSEDPLASGSFLRLDPEPMMPQDQFFETVTTSDVVVAGASWRDCNWWTLCIDSTHYREYFRTEGSKELNGYSLLADYGIPIEFIGFDEGLIDITSNGSVLINGSLNNRSGDTRITSNGAIEQLSASAVLSGTNIDLNGSSIGADGQFVRIGGLDGGDLNAAASGGSLFIDQLTGIMNVGAISALNGTVALSSDNDILGASGSSLVQANRVELTSRSGAIGSGSVFDSAGSFSIATGSTTDLDPVERARYGLVAQARDNIKIENTGDLMVIDVFSSAGDVRLEATGSIVDNNPVSRTDERTVDELNELWDSMRLRGQQAEDKAADEVRFFEIGVTQDYRTYWNQRNRQEDPAVYDPNFAITLSAAEEMAIRDQLAAQGRPQADIDATIASYADDRTAEYHRLHQRLYDPMFSDAVDGAIPDTFDDTFMYTASASEVTARTTGSSWEQFQLELPVAAGLLKEITDTVTEVKDPNIRGNNVVLLAGNSVGFDELARVIDLGEGLDALNRSDRAAIAAAERGDVTVMGDILEIIKRTPVNIEQTRTDGVVRVDATTGYAYLGSEMDLYIDQVRAAGDVRIKVAGSLWNANLTGGPNVIGDTIILEAARGNIGTADAPFGIEMGANGAFVARALDAIHAQTTAGDFRLDTLYSRGDVFLTSGGSILDAFDTDDLNLLGSSIYLDAIGSIGENLNPLDVGNDPLGIIEATSGPGQGIYLNVPEGTARFGALMAGGMINLSSSVGYTIDGLIQSPGSINLSAVRNIEMGDNGSLVSMGDQISIIAGSFTMAETASVDADGNLIITVADREVDDGQGSTTTIPGGAVISTASAGNDIDITAGSGGVTVTQALTAGGSVDVDTSGSITGNRVAGGVDVNLAATDQVQLDTIAAGAGLTISAAGVDVTSATAGASASVTAGADGARFETLTVADDLAVVSAADFIADNATSGGATNIQAGGDISIVDALMSGGVLSMMASGSISAASIDGGADVAILADEQIDIESLVVADDLAMTGLGVDIETADVGGAASVTAGTDGARFGTLTVGSDLTVDSAATVMIDSATSGGATDIQAAGDISVVDILMSGGALTMASSGSISAANIDGGADVDITADDLIDIESLVVANDLAATGLGIDIDDTTVGGSAAIDGGTGGLTFGTMTAMNDIAMNSGAGVAFDTLTAGGLIDITAVSDIGGNPGVAGEVIAAELSMTSTAGSIGSLNQRLDIEVPGNVSLSAFDDIGVHARNGDLMANLVTSQQGSIDLLISDGAAMLGLVSAPEEIIIHAASGLTADEILNARAVMLAVDDEGGTVAVDTLSVGSSLMVNADFISLPDIEHLGQAQPLTVDLTGNDGGIAQRIEFVADSAVGIDFVNFRTNEFEMAFTNDLLNFTAMEIGDFGRLTTPTHDIVIDNVNRVLYPSATAQLYALNEPFNLSTTNENLIFTTARIVDYNPFYIVNQFSTENSLVRLVPKRLTLWERVVRDLSAPPYADSFTVDDDEVIDIDPRGVYWVEGAPPIPLQLD